MAFPSGVPDLDGAWVLGRVTGHTLKKGMEEAHFPSSLPAQNKTFQIWDREKVGHTKVISESTC